MTKIGSHALYPLLKTQSFGVRIYSFGEVGSTNEVARELARNGAPHGTVVIADSQTKGKGRLGRDWMSPGGVNVYISFVLRPRIRISDAPFITFAASIALVEALRALGIESSIKWPNDLLIGGRKVAGVLTETEPEGEGVSFVILGVGVNVNMTREMMEERLGEVAPSATSLREAKGSEVDRVEFAASLIGWMEKCYEEFVNLGTEHLAREWSRRCGMMGKRVEVASDGEVVKGVAQGIDRHGYLLVKTDEGRVERIVSGDVVVG